MGAIWTTKCSLGGMFSRFVEYTGRLNSYLSSRMTLTLAVISTGAEILFGRLLLVGWYTRTAALLSGILLMAFGLAMALALGAKAPLDFSVFSAAGGMTLGSPTTLRVCHWLNSWAASWAWVHDSVRSPVSTLYTGVSLHLRSETYQSRGSIDEPGLGMAARCFSPDASQDLRPILHHQIRGPRTWTSRRAGNRPQSRRSGPFGERTGQRDYISSIAALCGDHGCRCGYMTFGARLGNSSGINALYVRIPSDGDQRSDLMAIAKRGSFFRFSSRGPPAISEDLVFEASDAAAVEAVAGLLPQPFDCAGIVIAVAEIVI